MKFVLLAAALIATPALAQTSGSTGTSSPTNVGGSGQATDTRNAATAADPSAATQPMTQQAPTDTMPAQSTGASSTAGGYMPGQPALSGAAQPGVTPVFQAAPSPSQAFPPPAPLASYPVCKKGQFDKCMQRGGK